MKSILKTGIYFFIFFTITAGGIMLLKPGKKTEEKDGLNNSRLVEHIEEKEMPVKSAEKKSPAAMASLKTDYSTNDEIKEEYGRLETVELFSGEEFTGAVVAVDSDYTMITIAGVKKFPMDKVKSRIIHR